MLLAAFTLGLLGSLHCVGMCGPLVLAMPAGPGGAVQRWLRRLLYHLSRSLVYGLMGAALGGAGQAVASRGWQGALSVLAGLSLLVLAWPRRVDGAAPAGAFTRALHRFRHLWRRWLDQPGWAAPAALGGLNALLPCGLVYAALAASTVAGGAAGGFRFMFVFGLATLPALLAVSATPALLRPSWRAPLRRLAPLAAGALAVLLICRGLGFGPCCAPPAGGGDPPCAHCVDGNPGVGP